jgi:dTMP kinase
MQKKTHKGKLIVFEGLDGSGKSTQTKLLESRLKKEGYRVVRIDFPQYGKKSAGLVEEYLNGKYGTTDEVGPYRASIFYACDRYDASFQIRQWLEEGTIVISDRYVGSNVGHQGGKIKDKEEREKYLKWLFGLEYNVFGIPRPDITFLLKTSPEWSLKLAGKITDPEKLEKRKSYLGGKEKDLHEEDRAHLANALESYLEAVGGAESLYRIIECVDGDSLLLPEVIHEKIWQMVKFILSDGD